MELVFKKLFKKNAKKLVNGNEKIENRINDVIFDFSNNLFESRYYRKPLKNLGKNIHELEVGLDIRIIIEIVLIDDVIIFLNIGTHSSLELSSNKRVRF